MPDCTLMQHECHFSLVLATWPNSILAALTSAAAGGFVVLPVRDLILAIKPWLRSCNKSAIKPENLCQAKDNSVSIDPSETSSCSKRKEAVHSAGHSCTCICNGMLSDLICMPPRSDL